MDLQLKGKTALVVSPTHAEADRITGEIRKTLQQKGTIGAAERTFQVLENRHLTEAEREEMIEYYEQQFSLE